MQEPPEHLQSKLVENMTAQVAEKGQTSLSLRPFKNCYLCCHDAMPCFAKKTLLRICYCYCLLVVIDSSLRNRRKVGSQSDIRYVLCAPESLRVDACVVFSDSPLA